MASAGAGRWATFGGQLDYIDHLARSFFELRVSLDTQGTSVWLTHDGTSTGDNIVGSGSPPWVEVYLPNQIPAGGGSVSSLYGWGDLMDYNEPSSTKQYRWSVVYSSSRWLLQINRFPSTSSSSSQTAIILATGWGSSR
jgi:hypothetical protein